VRLGPAKNSSGKLRIGIAGQHEHAFPCQLVERFSWPEATGLDVATRAGLWGRDTGWEKARY
jgi:hypothetical protein